MSALYIAITVTLVGLYSHRIQLPHLARKAPGLVTQPWHLKCDLLVSKMSPTFDVNGPALCRYALGYPLVSGVAVAFGVTVVWALRLFGFLDAAIYVFIPQIATWMIRAWQGRAALRRALRRSMRRSMRRFILQK